MSGLYIHIPFCERKCSYCAFYSVVSPSTELRAGNPWKKQEQFFSALGKEIKNLPEDFSPETIFIGGGTPTAPDIQMLESFFPSFEKFHPAEFSVEANPGTVDAAKLALLKRSGVNRLSIGIQSFDSRCLETLGRIHSAEQAEAAFRLARAAGFENISLDLIFGVPGQTMDMLESDLDRALALNPEHIAIYNLMYEEGTPLTKRNLPKLDEELERDMYDRIRGRLKAAGFVHYEISNFAKPGFECRHNRLYWNGGEYFGCGPAAHSHWKGTRWANVSDLDDYCANDPCREFEETLDPEAKERETLVMGLRQIAGVEVSSGLWKTLEETLRTLEKEGLLEIAGRHVRLTEEALFVSDAVFSELV
ncbi:MAG: radical SAM family heme chaperone HemW [Kiritimatiellaceae bacterium]|nr:radical SAM family heme chaperone HemW [Kiritimatiellaceae bacterium]